jgi:homogentisate phytyltransferase/homogentisate geranylgeranyltransferase
MLGHVTAWSTPGLAFALWGSAVLGTLYSLPPFRLKRFPLLAAFCIVAVRGTIINASFFAHATAAAFGGSGSVLQALLTNDRCLLSSLFYCVFGVVIALMKDVPDVDGDRSSNVRTFSVRIGQQQVFHASRRLLTSLFWVFGFGFARSAVTATTATLQLCRAVAAVAAFSAGNSVRRQSRSVDPTDSQQVYTYYMHLWKLFYASYLALPFAR